MLIFPAIDLIDGQAVRLFQGDYAQKTVFHNDPVQVALDFKAKGATHIHLVDLDGAKTGGTPNFEVVRRIKEQTGLFCEIGGGIRNEETVERYLACGLDRVIIGTAAVTQEGFAARCAAAFGSGVSVGVDLRNGQVAIHGWTRSAAVDGLTFCRQMEAAGIRHMIVTDIAKDGAMAGTNRELYRTLTRELSMDITASGGVSDLEDVKALRALSLYGAIIGKAYYTGAIDLARAMEVAQ